MNKNKNQIYKQYKNIVIITDDGCKSKNTKLLYSVLKDMKKCPILYFTKYQTSAKSNSISLNPIELKDYKTVKIIDGYPADCFLYSIFNSEIHNNSYIYIFGINEHNHYGYSNYVGSTTSLLQLAKHFGIHAFSISSEIKLNKNDILSFLKSIFSIISLNPNKYISFNINNNDDFYFKKTSMSKDLLDKYEQITTKRGKYIQISYNREFIDSYEDIYLQTIKQNYMVML